ncbi:ParB/RepB/Spo0J family partition protein [Malikia sp.]|uniref:ParB/RepB/Spo0J family partition protein n=1 Tax=Malikia sp. TaxID=2070706 RepID=UPI00262E6FE4|nr:ParB/RepB/Spo0J family partition protein [Malikia sp.]MDD2728300.1 ParB/RepB/Spo0J family partition protein [Malikia sp.]
MNPSHPLPEVDHFDHLPLPVLVTSPTNPRKQFDPAKLQELAESIRATGVHQPILVRPLPGHRLQETFDIHAASGGLQPRPTHEIVAGERRFRACQIAGLATVPAMVRSLTDDEVLEIQLIENLQRDGLTELEEAEGYETLMRHSQLSAEAVGAKIGKSRSYVYARLKLLELGPDGREALRQGRMDASHALLIARIPDTKLQAAAVKDIAADSNGENAARSYRQAQRLVRNHYMLKLSDAPFDIHDANLVPASGSCATCPKRTGADPDLFADVDGEDLCINPGCHQAKREALATRTKREAHERGQVIIEGRDAKALMPMTFQSRVDGHCRLDDPADSPTSQPLRAIIGKVMAEQGIVPVLVANPYKDGELLACLPNDVVAQLLKAAGRAEEAGDQELYNQNQKKAAAEKAKAEAKTEYETEWRWLLLVTTWREITEGRDEVMTWPALMRHLAMAYAHKLNQEQCGRLCKLLELGKVAPKQGLLDWVKDGDTDPTKAVLLLVMFADVGYLHWLDESDTNVGLRLVASEFGIDPALVQAEVKARTRAAVKAVKAAEAAKADLPLPPAAQANGVRGEAVASDGPAARGSRKGEPGRGRGKRKAEAPTKPKAREKEVRSGIAAAMRGLEDESVAAAGGEGDGARPEAAGDRPADVNERPGLGGKRVAILGSAIGKAGRVVGQHSSGDLFVIPDGLDCEYRFSLDELELIVDQEEGAQA